MESGYDAPDISTEMALRQAGAASTFIQATSLRAAQGVTDSGFSFGTHANRPPNGAPGDRYYETDRHWLYYWTGTAWKFLSGLNYGTNATRAAITVTVNDDGALFVTTDTRAWWQVSSGVWVARPESKIAETSVTLDVGTIVDGEVLKRVGTTIVSAPASTGTVTSVSVVTANGVSGSVANSTTTPAITLTLGAITPSSVNGLTLIAQAVGFTIAGGTTSKTLTVPLNATVSGTNTGDQDLSSYAPKASPAFTSSLNFSAAGNSHSFTWTTSSTGTGYQYGTWANDGAQMLWGIESSVGGALFTGSTAYASVWGTNTNTPMQFSPANIVAVTITPLVSGAGSNVKIGGTAVRGTTEGTNHLDIYNGTAPAGTGTNFISLYCTSGELRVMDSGGTATLLSQHAQDAPTSMYDDDDQPPNISRETNAFAGNVRFINFTRAARLQQALFMEEALPKDLAKRQIINEETFDDYNKRLSLTPDDPRFLALANWDVDQENHFQRREQEIAEWQQKKPEPGVRFTDQPKPDKYKKLPRPTWLKGH